MSWFQTTSGLYQRPLGGAERGYVAAIAAERPLPRELIKIHSFVELSTQSPTQTTVDAFRDAWKAIRLLRTPDIATTFNGQHCQYQVPLAVELQQWLDRTFVVAQPDTSTEDVTREMQDRWEFMPVCYIIPRSTQNGLFRGTIVTFISHWRTEASGVYQMIGQLCDYAHDLLTGNFTREALSEHILGSEAKLLVPTLEGIVMPNKESSPESKARIEAQFNNYYAHLPCIELPMQAESTVPYSNVLLRRHVYSTQATSDVVSACKTLNLTVTAAIHAAYIGAARSVSDPAKQDRHYASLMPAQVRPRLPVSSPYRSQGCWNASQLMMLVVPASFDFIQRAQSLGQQYSIAGSNQWWFEDVRAVIEQTELMPTRSPPNAIAVPYFTSLGILDREIIPQEHGSVRIENVWGWADPMGPGCVLTMWTFDEKLNVQITWNATYHAGDQIDQILNAIEATLTKELDVEVGTPACLEAKY